MTQQNLPAPLADQAPTRAAANPAPDAAARHQPDGFFSHHGVWAPGVRLFRRLGFGHKALVITLSFLLPIGLLLALLVQQMQAQIDFTAQERAGVATLAKLAPVLRGVVATRSAAQAMLGGAALLIWPTSSSTVRWCCSCRATGR
jgi:hypothetical protein